MQLSTEEGRGCWVWGFLQLKKYAVKDTVILEDEGEPTDNYYEYGIPSDINNMNSCKTKVQGYPS